MKVLINKYEKSARRFHLVLDELDAELIDMTEAKKILKLLTENEKLIQFSHLLFILRSLRERIGKFIEYEKEVSYNSFKQYKLIKSKMHLIELDTAMRTSQNVFFCDKSCS